LISIVAEDRRSFSSTALDSSIADVCLCLHTLYQNVNCREDGGVQMKEMMKQMGIIALLQIKELSQFRYLCQLQPPLSLLSQLKVQLHPLWLPFASEKNQLQ
jgi:hypothetical protein